MPSSWARSRRIPTCSGTPVLQRDYPLLCRAAEETGGVATQNRGTIGGNIANASPAADTPPALLTYDAEIELVSTRGTRRIGYDRFHLGYKKHGPGVRRADRADRAAEAGHTLGAVPTARSAPAVPRRSRRCAWPRLWMSIRPSGVLRDVRIAFGSVAPVPLRAKQSGGRAPRRHTRRGGARERPAGAHRTTSSQSMICAPPRATGCRSRRAFWLSAWRPSDQLRVPRA